MHWKWFFTIKIHFLHLDIWQHLSSYCCRCSQVSEMVRKCASCQWEKGNLWPYYSRCVLHHLGAYWKCKIQALSQDFSVRICIFIMILRWLICTLEFEKLQLRGGRATPMIPSDTDNVLNIYFCTRLFTWLYIGRQ